MLKSSHASVNWTIWFFCYFRAKLAPSMITFAVWSRLLLHKAMGIIYIRFVAMLFFLKIDHLFIQYWNMWLVMCFRNTLEFHETLYLLEKQTNMYGLETLLFTLDITCLCMLSGTELTLLHRKVPNSAYFSAYIEFGNILKCTITLQ